MRIVTSILIAAVLFGAPAAGQTAPPKVSAAQQMSGELAAKDAELFDALFNKCLPDKLKDLITEDLEFYHDKWGQIAKSGAEFVEAIRRGCERQKQGVDYRARRELVKESVRVYPLNNYGAIHMGEHRFFKLTPGKADELTEISKFTNLWKKENGAWRLARVLSYDHRDPQGAPLAERVGKNDE